MFCFNYIIRIGWNCTHAIQNWLEPIVSRSFAPLSSTYMLLIGQRYVLSLLLLCIISYCRSIELICRQRYNCTYCHSSFYPDICDILNAFSRGGVQIIKILYSYIVICIHPLMVFKFLHQFICLLQGYTKHRMPILLK